MASVSAWCTGVTSGIAFAATAGAGVYNFSPSLNVNAYIPADRRLLGVCDVFQLNDATAADAYPVGTLVAGGSNQILASKTVLSDGILTLLDDIDMLVVTAEYSSDVVTTTADVLSIVTFASSTAPAVASGLSGATNVVVPVNAVSSLSATAGGLKKGSSLFIKLTGGASASRTISLKKVSIVTYRHDAHSF